MTTAGNGAFEHAAAWLTRAVPGSAEPPGGLHFVLGSPLGRREREVLGRREEGLLPLEAARQRRALGASEELAGGAGDGAMVQPWMEEGDRRCR